MTDMVALLVYLLFTQALSDATITWTAPPPQRGPLLVGDVTVRRTTQQLVINSPEERLKWNYTLSGEIFDIVTWTKDGVTIGKKTSSGLIVIEPVSNFRNHFAISASDPATLIIKNLTEADGGVFRCSVLTSVRTWADEIEVEIVVPVKFFNNVSVDRTVSESSDLQLYCGASGRPAPNITWIRVLANGSEGQVLHRTPTWNIANINRTDAGTYRCTAKNGVGNPVSHSLTVNVLYSTITWTAPPPQRGPLLVGDVTVRKTTQQLILNSPEERLKWEYTLSGEIFDRVTWTKDSVTIGRKTSSGLIVVEPVSNFRDHFAISASDPATLIIYNVTKADRGVFRCSVLTSVRTWADEIEVEIVVPVKFFNNVSVDRTLSESSDLQLYCGASGRPAPNITWIRVFANGTESQVLHRTPTWNITNINRTDAGTYRCTANDGVRNPASHTLTVNVLYRSRIVNLPIEYNVAVNQSVVLHCRAEGNPDPSFTWTPCKDVCNKSTLIIPEVWNDGVYTCTVTNILGSDSGSTKVVIAGSEINVTLTITSESCIDGKYNKFLMLSKNLNEAVSNIFADKSAYLRTTVMDVRCGSLIVDLALKFSTTVPEKWVLTMLKEATKDGKLGEFSVNTSSIIGTRVFIQSSFTPPISKTTPSSSDVEECRRCSCNCAILSLLIAVSTIFAAIIILLIVYIIWLHKKGATGRGGWYTQSAGEKGNSNTAVEMEVRQPDRIPSRQQMSEVSSRSQYMALDDARRSNDLPDVTTKTDTSQTSQYAPLHPSTLSGEIPRENVTVEKIIGKGAFGQVAKGTVVGLRGRPQMTLVAVKMLKANAPESDRKDLLSELEVMKTLKPHPHVIKLLGCVTESEPLLVLIEYVPYGDLLGYLRKSRGLNDTYYKDPDIKPQTSLTSQQLMKFAWQIADGMSYLSSRSIIHRDLAARNVLVGEKETCKVTDFGMARDVQQENIYERKTKGRLPVKWTAYEALMYGTYTTKSDVWSYGILLYEIFTIGGSPYPRMDGRKIASLLQQGYRMPKPQHVDDELYKIMTTCWEENPDVRPTFAELRNKLKKMENQHKRLINMKMYDTQLYANVEDLVV